MLETDVVAIGTPLALSNTERTKLLGGKGANLAEMRQALNLPVPPAFVITTDACRSYLDGSWPEGLSERIADGIASLGSELGRRFGSPERPLLVSVRSGAPVSMPGMLDTVLNVGMNPEIRDGFGREVGDDRFAAQCWLRFCQMYADVVLGIDPALVAAAISEAGGGVEPNELSTKAANAAAEAICALAERQAAAGVSASLLPLDPFAQLTTAVEAVFRSWMSPRAEVFRSAEGIDASMGTAVTVQAMVFGNLDARSGTGVLFTRDPATGENAPYGDYLAQAQGEDVVAGSRAVESLEAMANQLPAVHGDLLAIGDRLEQHYRDLCDVEFTVSQGELFILQTRIGRRSPAAAVRAAVEMATDDSFPLTRAEAIARISPNVVEQLAGAGSVLANAVPVGLGLGASPGVGTGALCCDPDRAAEMAKDGAPVVLARAETSPADVHGMVGAAAIVTALGGVVSHAAVVARSWGIPAATGMASMSLVDGGIEVDGRSIAEGATVTVCGSTGGLYLGDQRDAANREPEELGVLRRWAAELGLEFGEAASEGTGKQDSASDRPVGTFEAMRAVQLKGMCSAEAAAEAVGSSPEAVVEALEPVLSLLKETPRGWMMTPEAKRWLEAELDRERSAVDPAGFEEIYGEFLPLNDEFKVLIVGWQETDRGEAAVVQIAAALSDLHERFEPVVGRTVMLAERLTPYAGRFTRSLGQVVAGDGSMVASPLKDSYHTVWFEFHEELIHLSGRNRADEERSEAERHG